MQLAELNWGQLTYDWDDPRTVDFQNGLAVVNGAAERSPGFIWRMSDEDMEAVQLDLNGPFQGLPRIASMLSVWDDVVSLRNFVFQTIL